MFDQIVDFDAVAKYYPAGSNPAAEPPHDPLGLNKDLLPLERNVTFVFNCTQGTVQTLYFFETIGGANVSISNHTLNATDCSDLKRERVPLHFNTPGVHNIYVLAGNALELSPAVPISFELVVGVFDWTVTAASPWIKEDPSNEIIDFFSLSLIAIFQ